MSTPHTDSPHITTVVFDLGGVLIDWDPRYLYGRLMPEDEVEVFLEEIGFAEWNHEQDAGGSWADAVAAHAARHPDRRELIEAYPQRFVETLGGAIAGTVTILEELHAAGVPLLAVTNWSAETFQVARREYAFLDLFDGIVVSGEEHVAKPDPRIFAILLRRHNLEAANTVYVDDSPTNVASAQTAGLVAVRYDSPRSLRDQLIELGVLPKAEVLVNPRSDS